MTNEFLEKEIEEVKKEIEKNTKDLEKDVKSGKGFKIANVDLVSFKHCEISTELNVRLQTLKECQSKEKEKHKKFVDKLKEFLRGYTPNYNYVCEQIDKFSENLE